MILRSEIAQRVFETPLMMHPAKAAAVLAAVGGRIVEGGVQLDNGLVGLDHVAYENGRPSMGIIGDRLGRVYDRHGIAPFDMVGRVAVIPIEGTLVQKGAFVGMSSGRTSYQGLQTQITRAMRSDVVGGVVFEVDSFGGEVAGCFETGEMLAELSAAKPTLSILTDNSASAAYLLASATRQIVMPERGNVGSIGALSLHIDLSQKLENEGIKVTMLTAGRHKADGNQFQPLPEDLADKRRAVLEELRQQFARFVGEGRGERFSAQDALDTEAEVFRARAAVRSGMVDAIGDPQKAFAAFVNDINQS